MYGKDLLIVKRVHFFIFNSNLVLVVVTYGQYSIQYENSDTMWVIKKGLSNTYNISDVPHIII